VKSSTTSAEAFAPIANRVAAANPLPELEKSLKQLAAKLEERERFLQDLETRLADRDRDHAGERDADDDGHCKDADAFRGGARDYLKKPFSYQQLHQRVAPLLALRQKSAERRQNPLVCVAGLPDSPEPNGDDPETTHYFERRVKEGRTKRDVIRILQRYIAREVYRYLPRG